MQRCQCTCHTLLDHDKAGLLSYEKAKADGLIVPADVTHVICAGLDESEFEDMLDEPLYADFLKNKYELPWLHLSSKENANGPTGLKLHLSIKERFGPPRWRCKSRPRLPN